MTEPQKPSWVSSTGEHLPQGFTHVPGTRIRDPKYGKEGIILAYTSKGVPVVEWDGGGVSTFDGEYEVIQRGMTEEERITRYEEHERWLDMMMPTIKRGDPLRMKNPYGRK